MITYNTRSFQDLLSDPDFVTMMYNHWQEVECHQDKIHLSPDFNKYLLLDDLDLLLVTTVCDDEELIGYSIYIIGPHPHHSDSLFAVNDSIFLAKDYRKGMNGVKLIKYSERLLKERGVDMVTVNVKRLFDFGNILRYLGYEPLETVHGKYLGD